MKRWTLNLARTLAMAALGTLTLSAGGMRLEIGNAKAHPEAAARKGLVLARLTACQTPAKAVLTVTAEGIVDGKRRSIPVAYDSLATTGTWSIARNWPAEGKWALRLVASHPDYGTYHSSVLVRVEGDTFDWGKVKPFYGNPPAPSDVTDFLTK